MSGCLLHFDIHSFWHPGTGRGAGSALDSLVHRDSNGLPVLPGRTVKGLLRDAVYKAARLNWYEGDDPTNSLFGQRPDAQKKEQPQNDNKPGTLRVSDACLPEDLTGYLLSENGRDLVPGLYRSLFATAIDHESSTAKDKSLRGYEVIIPLGLIARVDEVLDGHAPTDWQDKLCMALPLLRGLGSHRNRGLGRVLVTLERKS